MSNAHGVSEKAFIYNSIFSIAEGGNVKVINHDFPKCALNFSHRERSILNAEMIIVCILETHVFFMWRRTCRKISHRSISVQDIFRVRKKHSSHGLSPRGRVDRSFGEERLRPQCKRALRRISVLHLLSHN